MRTKTSFERVSHLDQILLHIVLTVGTGGVAWLLALKASEWVARLPNEESRQGYVIFVPVLACVTAVLLSRKIFALSMLIMEDRKRTRQNRLEKILASSRVVKHVTEAITEAQNDEPVRVGAVQDASHSSMTDVSREETVGVIGGSVR